MPWGALYQVSVLGGKGRKDAIPHHERWKQLRKVSMLGLGPGALGNGGGHGKGKAAVTDRGLSGKEDRDQLDGV